MPSKKRKKSVMQSASPVSNADPVLVDIEGSGLATFSDGSKLNFPDGCRFTNRNLDLGKHKLGCRVELWAKDADGKDVEVTSFVLIKGATKGCVENAVRACFKALEE